MHLLRSSTEIRTLSFLVILYVDIELVCVGAEKEGAAKARRSKLKGPTSIMLDQRRVQSSKPLKQVRIVPGERPDGSALIKAGYT